MKASSSSSSEDSSPECVEEARERAGRWGARRSFGARVREGGGGGRYGASDGAREDGAVCVAERMGRGGGRGTVRWRGDDAFRGGGTATIRAGSGGDRERSGVDA